MLIFILTNLKSLCECQTASQWPKYNTIGIIIITNLRISSLGGLFYYTNYSYLEYNCNGNCLSFHFYNTNFIIPFFIKDITKRNDKDSHTAGDKLLSNAK